jgi:hypothetical protein
VAEVLSLEQQRVTLLLGKGIGEAVAEVQPGRVPGSLAEVAVGLAGDAGLGDGDRCDGEAAGLHELVEPAYGDRIPARIDDDGSLYVAGRGDQGGVGGGSDPSSWRPGSVGPAG